MPSMRKGNGLSNGEIIQEVTDLQDRSLNMSGIRWTHEEVEQYLQKHFKADDHSAVPAPDAKPDRRNAPAPKNAAKEISPRFSITIHHRSRRLADPTGRSHSAVVNGLVRGGILPDDSPLYVKEIRETYEQRKNEETVIQICSITKSHE
jgi:hypothetical protein